MYSTNNVLILFTFNIHLVLIKINKNTFIFAKALYL